MTPLRISVPSELEQSIVEFGHSIGYSRGSWTLSDLCRSAIRHVLQTREVLPVSYVAKGLYPLETGKPTYDIAERIRQVVMLDGNAKIASIQDAITRTYPEILLPDLHIDMCMLKGLRKNSNLLYKDEEILIDTMYRMTDVNENENIVKFVSDFQ